MIEKRKISHIAISDVDTQWCLLRSAKRDEAEFRELKSSIRGNGVGVSILVRNNPDTSSSKPYSLIDGLQRLTCSIELGKDSIPAQNEGDCSDQHALELQIEMNLQGVKTKPGEFARLVKRFYLESPNLNIVALADRLHVRPQWVRERLSISELPPEVLDLIDSDKITVGNAELLAKLPPTDVSRYLDQSQELKKEDFKELILKRLKFHRTKNLKEKPEDWKPKARFKNISDIQSEYNSKDAPYLKKLLGEEPTQRDIKIYKLALGSALSLDVFEAKRRKDAYMKLEIENEKRDLAKKRANKARKKLALESELREIDRQYEDLN